MRAVAASAALLLLAACSANTLVRTDAGPAVTPPTGVSVSRGAGVLDAGDMDAGIWSAGQTQGLIHDIPTCKDLVANIMRQAEQVLENDAKRLVSKVPA